MMDDRARLYFDNAATSFPKPPEVYDALDRFARENAGSAGRSAHEHAIAGARLLFELRTELAVLLGGEAELVIFTKNATEALNLALLGLLGAGATALHGALEHNSVVRPLAHLAQARGVNSIEVAGDEQGRLTPDALDRALRHRLYGHLNPQAIERPAPDRLILRMLTCRVQEARRRKGLADFPCRSVGIVEYSTFARAVDPRIETRCLVCPPDPPLTGEACAWEFRLGDGGRP